MSRLSPGQQEDRLRRDAVIALTRHDERRGIVDAGSDVVQGRVAEKVPEHVEHADLRDGRSKEFGSLGDRGANEEPAVTAALNGEPRR